MTGYAPYARRSDAVVAYTYQAETLCPECTVTRVAGPDMADLGSPEMVLNYVAEQIGLDRTNERGFDTDDFPKVVLDVQVEDEETCMGCGDMI